MNLFPHIIVAITYKCYHWTANDLINIGSEGGSVKSQKNTCEQHGNIFIDMPGDEYKAPGCGGCWCCQPKSISGKYKYI